MATVTPETIITILLVAVLATLAFLALRRAQAPQPETQRLAITVWAAYGPYDDAAYAENRFRAACRTVFGTEGAAEHEEWIKGHVKNFRDWEAEGRFKEAQKVMQAGLLLTGYGEAFDTACKEFRAQAAVEAREAIEELNKSLLEPGGHRIEAVDKPDGTVKFLYIQIWSDEEIERKEKEDGEAIFNGIGGNLLSDQSQEAKELLAFLEVVYEANMGEDLKDPKDIGIIWFSCLEVVDKDPNSYVAQGFKVLNDAWSAAKSDNEP